MEYEYRECLNQCVNVRIEPGCCHNGSHDHSHNEENNSCCKTACSCGCSGLFTTKKCGCN